MAAPTSVNKRLQSRTFVKVSSVSDLLMKVCMLRYAFLQVSKKTFTSLSGTPNLRNFTEECDGECKDIPIHYIEANEFL